MKKNFRKNYYNKYRPNKRLRYINNDYSYRINKYQSSTRPATFGPGTYKFCVSKIITGELSTETTLFLYTSILFQNPELERIKEEFKYLKLTNLTLNFYPRNIFRTDNSNLSPLYFLINYDGNPTRNLRLQDSVKIVPAYHTRNKIFKFKIPYLEAGTGLLNSWQSMDTLGKFDNILIQMHAPDNTTSWYVRIDANIVVRGPTSSQTQVVKVEEIRQLQWDSDEEKRKYNNFLNKLKNKIENIKGEKEIIKEDKSIGDINIKEEILKEEKEKEKIENKIKLLERKMKLDGERYKKNILKEKEINDKVKNELNKTIKEIKEENYKIKEEMEEDKKLLICLQEELIDKGEIERKSKSKSCMSSFVEY